MQEHMDNWSNSPDGPPRKKSRTRTMFLRFLFGGLGFVLLTAVAAAAMVPQLTSNRQETYAHSAHTTTQGSAKLTLDPNAHTLTIEAKVSGAPHDTPLVMHVHGDGNCSGSKLYMLQATSDDMGKVSITMTFQDEQDTTIPTNWFFNVHDTTQGPSDMPLSIACGPIKVDSSGLIGRARLHSVQQQVQNQSLITQTTTEGLATFHLDPSAQKLTIQAIIFGAPPNRPLVMHIHGDGSCSGSILYMLTATSDEIGHALATETLDDKQDTTIPSNWFFNVHDTTQGPSDMPLSIACGPIQTIDSTTAFAKLNPVQPSSATATPNPSGDLTTVKTSTSTQSITEGLTTLHLDPNAHTLTIQAIVFHAPPNIPLVMHIHGDGSCSGSILYMLQTTSDDAGNAYGSMTFSQDTNGNPIPTTIPNNWFFNVHDTTRQASDGKPLSIACGPVEMADSSGLTAHALLDPVQPDQTTSPSTTAPVTKGPSTQSTTLGLTVLYLNSAAHTLNVLAHIVGAPPNAALNMDIHGDGSCTGPTLFMLQTKSDNMGNATAIMPFDDQQDTTIPNNWFFNVDNTAKQGPDGKPQSIACGPILTPGPVGLAQLSPVS